MSAEAAEHKKTIKLTLPEDEIMSPGHLACQGCGAANHGNDIRVVYKIVGDHSCNHLDFVEEAFGE